MIMDDQDICLPTWESQITECAGLLESKLLVYIKVGLK